jgi:uncharacterized protein (DUF2237 family)
VVGLLGGSVLSVCQLSCSKVIDGDNGVCTSMIVCLLRYTTTRSNKLLLVCPESKRAPSPSGSRSCLQARR